MTTTVKKGLSLNRTPFHVCSIWSLLFPDKLNWSSTVCASHPRKMCLFFVACAKHHNRICRQCVTRAGDKHHGVPAGCCCCCGCMVLLHTIETNLAHFPWQLVLLTSLQHSEIAILNVALRSCNSVLETTWYVEVHFSANHKRDHLDEPIRRIDPNCDEPTLLRRNFWPVYQICDKRWAKGDKEMWPELPPTQPLICFCSTMHPSVASAVGSVFVA